MEKNWEKTGKNCGKLGKQLELEKKKQRAKIMKNELENG